MLGSIDRAHVLRMLEALAQQDGARLLGEVDRLDELAPDYGAVLDELLAALQHLAVLQLVQGRSDEEDLVALAPLAAQISAEDVQLYYQIALQGRRDLAVCRDARMGFEMTLLRMLAFRPVDAEEAPRARPITVAQPMGTTAKPSPSKSTATAARPAAATIGRVATTASEKGTAAQGVDANVDWHELLQVLDVRGPARQLADHCELRSFAGGAWQLILPADKVHLNTSQIRTRLESALSEHLGRALRLTISPGQPTRPTPAEIRKASENERMREARESIENDPNVKAVQAAFDAVVEPDSIRSTQ